MLVALRRLGKSLLLAVLSAATLAAGAQSVSITPGYTNLGVNQTLQYTAAVTGLANKTVTWEVSGVKGGNATVGTITSNGLYKAPAAIPTVSTLIEAFASDKKTVAAVYVNIEPAGPTIFSASPNPIPTNPGRSQYPRNTTSSPSSRNPRRSPGPNEIGSRPLPVNSSKHPRAPSSGPDTVPLPSRSPG